MTFCNRVTQGIVSALIEQKKTISKLLGLWLNIYLKTQLNIFTLKSVHWNIKFSSTHNFQMQLMLCTFHFLGADCCCLCLFYLSSSSSAAETVCTYVNISFLECHLFSFSHTRTEFYLLSLKKHCLIQVDEYIWEMLYTNFLILFV